jgi:hypothetical protein
MGSLSPPFPKYAPPVDTKIARQPTPPRQPRLTAPAARTPLLPPTGEQITQQQDAGRDAALKGVYEKLQRDSRQSSASTSTSSKR